MEIFINTQGTAVKLSPQHVYQGTNVSQINLYAPFPSQTSLSVAFMLPDGTTTPYYPMTFTGITSDEAEGINLWQYVMPFAITQDAGAARVAFLATFNENGTAAQQTSAYVDFTIEQSALPVLPDEPTPDVWTQILSYLSAQDTKIAAIQSDVADIEQVADEANTNAGIALTTANEANTTATQAKTTADGIDGKATQALATSQTAEQTAQEAKTTADGLADSIAQANETASQANATAEEAKEIAEGAAQGNGTRVSVGGAFQQTLSFTSDPQAQITQNASAVAATEQSITDIENGTTTVAKANEATKATQDGDGNNIADTYATKADTAALDNISTAVGQIVTAGWHTIVELPKLNCASGLVVVKKLYQSSEPISVVFAYSQTGYGNPIITLLSCQMPAAFTGYKIGADTSNTKIQIYLPVTMSDNEWSIAVFNAQSGGAIAVASDEVDTDTSTRDTEIELAADVGLATTGKVFQDGAPVLAIDMETLPISAENGWSFAAAGGKFPAGEVENGAVYLICFDDSSSATDFSSFGSSNVVQPTLYNGSVTEPNYGVAQGFTFADAENNLYYVSYNQLIGFGTARRFNFSNGKVYAQSTYTIAYKRIA